MYKSVLLLHHKCHKVTSAFQMELLYGSCGERMWSSDCVHDASAVNYKWHKRSGTLTWGVIMSHVPPDVDITATALSGGPSLPVTGIALLIFCVVFIVCDRLCGLLVIVLGYRSGGPGSIPATTRKKKSSGSGTGSTQPREYNWGATW
jgi:hypothetical protein